MTAHELEALVAAAVLAGVHLLAGKLRFLGGVPRSAGLSAFGGISVAYVFVHLLPELAAGQAAVEEADEATGVLGFLEDHVYLMALLGLVVFYAVESHSAQSGRRRREGAGDDGIAGQAFWLSIASFSVYNAIIGYLLLREELDQTSALVLFTLALAVHFVVNDFALHERHAAAYRRVGRWIVAGAVLLGWGIGTLARVPEPAIALVVAFIAGGIVLNVLKEELPGERRARVLPFVTGAALYTALLQAA